MLKSGNFYASDLSKDFKKHENDWIVFECVQPEAVLAITHVHISQTGDRHPCRLKTMRISVSNVYTCTDSDSISRCDEKSDHNDDDGHRFSSNDKNAKWSMCDPSSIEVSATTSDMQVFEVKHASSHCVRFVRVEFMANQGYKGHGWSRYHGITRFKVYGYQ